MKKILLNNNDITNFIGEISLKDNIEELATEISFNSTKADFNCGDKIIFYNDEKIIFTGIIIDKKRRAKTDINYTCFDYGFYLNKSKTIKQFNNVSGSSAITAILTENNIQIGEMPNLSINVDKLYFENTINEIIEDILKKDTDETGKIYFKEVMEDKIYIFEKGTKKIDSIFKYNDKPLKIFDYIAASFTKNESMQDMKNKIVIVTGGDSAVRKLATKQDDESIAQYGLLEDVQQIDEKDISKATNIANTSLKELNKITKTFNIETLGNFEIRKGRVIELNIQDVDIIGTFLIKSTSHSIKNAIHTISLELELIE